MTMDNKIMSLHRYFIWMDRMRVHFDDVIAGGVNKYGSKERFDIESFLYMSYWYASMYVVIEGWKELKLVDPNIEELLKSPNVKLLKRYRHGVYHFQPEYWDSRFLDYFKDGENTVTWIRNLSKEFSRFFLEFWGILGTQHLIPRRKDN